jgi:hypothetical protein
MALIAHIVPGSTGDISLIKLLAIEALMGSVGIVINEFPTANQAPSLMIYMILRIDFYHSR